MLCEMPDDEALVRLRLVEGRELERPAALDGEALEIFVYIMARWGVLPFGDVLVKVYFEQVGQVCMTRDLRWTSIRVSHLRL